MVVSPPSPSSRDPLNDAAGRDSLGDARTHSLTHTVAYLHSSGGLSFTFYSQLRFILCFSFVEKGDTSVVP